MVLDHIMLISGKDERQGLKGASAFSITMVYIFDYIQFIKSYSKLASKVEAFKQQVKRTHSFNAEFHRVP